MLQTQWAWAANDGHAGGDGDVGIPQYTNYWKTYDNNCEFFKTNNIGWFLHTWSGEGAFDMVGDNGQYVIPNWRPQRCQRKAKWETPEGLKVNIVSDYCL